MGRPADQNSEFGAAELSLFDLQGDFAFLF
jgi:hypothetical protein